VIEAAGAEVVACDVAALAADLIAVEALARLQLTARRLGTSIRLRGAARDLVALLRLCGLEQLLAAATPVGTEQPDRRPHPAGGGG
jgi:ABC-type transporter Mla MlaB component